jgi:hypothetical protein
MCEKQKVNPAWTADELKAASVHFAYEFNMLMFTRRCLLACVFEGLLHNAMLESYLVHFRNMVDFLWLPCGRQDTDLIASRYFQEAQPWRPGDISIELADARTRVNKLLAHLTYDRTKMDLNCGRKIVDLFREIEGAYAVFLAHVSPVLLDAQSLEQRALLHAN